MCWLACCADLACKWTGTGAISEDPVCGGGIRCVGGCWSVLGYVPVIEYAQGYVLGYVLGYALGYMPW